MEAASVTAPRRPPRRRGRAQEAPDRQGPTTPWWMWIAVAAIVVFCLFPFYWLINISLKTGNDLQNVEPDPAAPDALQLQGDLQEPRLHRVAAQQRDRGAVPPRSSRWWSGRSAPTRWRGSSSSGKVVILAIVLSISTFPQIAIAAPLFKLWSDIGIFNTYIGLIIPYLTFALPLTIYILVSFFREIPKDLEEAALVDGATYFQAFRKVVVPLAAPGLATAGILTFIGAWNEFLLAVTLTSSSSARTVPAAIAVLHGRERARGALRQSIAAASIVISVPLILLVLFFQKRIVAGLTAGAVKG